MNTSRLMFPKLGGIYEKLADPSVTLLRVIAGLALVMHGWGKIQDPTGMAGMLEGIGFWPGSFWSVLVSVTEFFGGLMLALGFLTRPAAVAIAINLAVTIWFHWILKEQGYGGAEKSILWTAIAFYFAVHGAQGWSIDRLLKKEI